MTSFKALIKDIYKYSDQIIQKIKKYEAKLPDQIKENFDNFRENYVRKKFKEVSDLMRPVLKQYKLELKKKNISI